MASKPFSRFEFQYLEGADNYSKRQISALIASGEMLEYFYGQVLQQVQTFKPDDFVTETIPENISALRVGITANVWGLIDSADRLRSLIYGIDTSSIRRNKLSSEFESVRNLRNSVQHISDLKSDRGSKGKNPLFGTIGWADAKNGKEGAVWLVLSGHQEGRPMLLSAIPCAMGELGPITFSAFGETVNLEALMELCRRYLRAYLGDLMTAMQKAFGPSWSDASRSPMMIEAVGLAQYTLDGDKVVWTKNFNVVPGSCFRTKADG